MNVNVRNKMPYIKEDRRKVLDVSIDQIVLKIKQNINTNDNLFEKNNITNEEYLDIVGDINYCFSRIISKLMGETSYGKIAMITGVLENIKQEFYRRVASPYEDKKIIENGDIREYRKI